MSEETRSVRRLIAEAQLKAAMTLSAIVAACAGKALGTTEANQDLKEPSLPHAKFLLDFVQWAPPLEKKPKNADEKVQNDESGPEHESETAIVKRLIEELTSE